jgi:hypothetical protein
VDLGHGTDLEQQEGKDMRGKRIFATVVLSMGSLLLTAVPAIAANPPPGQCKRLPGKCSGKSERAPGQCKYFSKGQQKKQCR